MNLYEYEGKELLKKSGVVVPQSCFIDDATNIPDMTYPVFAKAQILSGGRKEAGGIVLVKDKTELARILEQWIGKKINGWPVIGVLCEEEVHFQGPEYFVSFTADSDTRTILLTLSDKGGTGIEDRPITKTSLNVDTPRFPDSPIPEVVLKKLFNIFCANDCTLLEVNPLVAKDGGGEWIALDAKVVLDDSALPRHTEWQYAERPSAPHHIVSPREIRAKAIDKGDHRGTAGSAYLDLDGDIAMLPSGGGASLTAMDALYRLGGKPANYTEYSGNPSGEKVKQLVSIVVSKPDLSALWVVGAVANFTDIYETLNGLIGGLRAARDDLKIPIDYPIVIRRAGPRDKEAHAMLREVKDFDLHVSGEETSIEESAKKVVALAHAYQKTHTR